MCEADKVEVLSFNGLGSAEGCRNAIKFPFSDVTLFNTIGGTLPACLWNLRNLSVLHMTGNGLTGEIIPHLPHYSLISDLSLSHNKFSGTIPLGIHAIMQVDLSYNQFSGKYEDHLQHWTNSFVNLEINRLSGQLPVSKLENVSDLNILKGNMFSCDTIPDNDEYVDDYICGSEDLNESLVVLSSILIIVMLVVCLAVVFSRFDSTSTMFTSSCIYVTTRRLHNYYTCVDQQKQQGDENSNLLQIKTLSDKFKKIIWLYIQLTSVMLVIISPIYIVKSGDAGNIFTTHTNTYSWFWTLAYMHGVVPSSMIMMSWMVMITMCFYHMILAPSIEQNPYGNVSQPHNYNSNPTDLAKDHTNSVDKQMIDTDVRTFKTSALIIALFVINAAITSVVNALYIYSTQQPLPVYIHFGIQLCFATFRLVYDLWVCPILSRPILDPVANITFRLRLLMLNNLAIPCFVTAFTSPACFQVQS
jgi:hypothetical protein